MRYLAAVSSLLATPAVAHEAALAHAHADWTLPVGLCLIALAGGFAALKARLRVRVRK